MEGVSVLHEEPFNEFGETSWAKYTLNKAADLNLRKHHFRCIFLFLKRSGHCSWAGVRANRSLPRVVLLHTGDSSYSYPRKRMIWLKI